MTLNDVSLADQPEAQKWVHCLRFWSVKPTLGYCERVY
jgi:hypothetical protein